MREARIVARLLIGPRIAKARAAQVAPMPAAHGRSFGTATAAKPIRSRSRNFYVVGCTAISGVEPADWNPRRLLARLGARSHRAMREALEVVIPLLTDDRTLRTSFRGAGRLERALTSEQNRPSRPRAVRCDPPRACK
jgi:hypothetical protein